MNQARKIKQGGFTLIELVIVLAIIAFLVTMSMPRMSERNSQLKIRETLDLVNAYKTNIEAYYRIHDRFPVDNAEAGLPAARKIIGKYLAEVELEDGAMQLVLGGSIASSLQNKVISIRPVYVPDSPRSPISWVCGSEKVPANMLAAGSNKTDVPLLSLPVACR